MSDLYDDDDESEERERERERVRKRRTLSGVFAGALAPGRSAIPAPLARVCT